MGGICPLSDIRANTISNAAGTGPIDLHKQSAAKAYHKCDSTGVLYSDTLNVSSLVEGNPTGKYEINLTNSMSDSNYSFNFSPTNTATAYTGICGSTTANSFEGWVVKVIDASRLSRPNCSAIHGGLA